MIKNLKFIWVSNKKSEKKSILGRNKIWIKKYINLENYSPLNLIKLSICKNKIGWKEIKLKE